MELSERVRFVQGLPPVADYNDSGPVYSDIVNCRGAAGVTFLLIRGVGTTGTTALTVEACDDVSPSHTQAIPFRYKQITAADAEAALAQATSAGYTTTAGSNAIDVIEVDPAYLGAYGYGYCRLKCTEVNGAAVLAGILIAIQAGFAGDAKASPLT